MEIFEPLAEFYEAIANDPRIGVTHISLYMALLQQWNVSGGINPVIVIRTRIMQAAKINSRYTYNKSMNNLHEFGYIKYLPASSPFRYSVVYLKRLNIRNKI